jgi:hypothetical protein
MAELDNNSLSSDIQIISVIFPRLGIIANFGKLLFASDLGFLNPHGMNMLFNFSIHPS